MATSESVKAKLQDLIDNSNRVMGGERKTLTLAINSLINGFGNEPIAYEDAEEGEKLYTAYFSTNNFQEGMGGTWQAGIKDGAVVAEINRLIVDNRKYQNHFYQDQRYKGTFPMYDLENKTYTLEFEFFKEPSVFRHRAYFAKGVFIDATTGEKMDGSYYRYEMFCLGIQLQQDANGVLKYQFVDNGSNFTSANLNQPKNKIWEIDGSGERSAKLRIVLKGGEKREDVTINASNGTWRGDIIPLEFTIYHLLDSVYEKVGEGLIYHTADTPLVFGTGSYEIPTGNQYYGLRNLTIYKGDRAEANSVAGITADMIAEGGLAEVNLPNATTIKQYAFYSDKALVNISMPKVTDIRNAAFAECSNLAITSLPSELTVLGSGCFTKCKELQLTELPDTLTVIDASVFSSCSKLAITEIPASVRTIGAGAFSFCTFPSITFKGKPISMYGAFQNNSNIKIINVPWAEGAVADAPWGATNAVVTYNYTEE